MNKKLFGAIARGWCHPKNSHKVMDVDLANAIASEIEKSLKEDLVDMNCIGKGEFSIVNKPWGQECWLELNEHYCLKRIYINSGCRTSLQYHDFKTETNCLIFGKARVLIGETWHEINANDYFTIKPKVIHRIEALTDVVLQEVSTPQISDVIRVSDDTGRPHGRIESEHIN